MSREGQDFELFELLNRGIHKGMLEAVLHFFAVDGQLLFVALLVVLFLGRGPYASVEGRRGVVAACFAAAIALALAQAIGHIWVRPRPFVAHAGDVHLFLPRSPDASFPSDHATASFAIGVALLMRRRTVGLVALALALVMCLSRVALGTHYPGDVAGGAVLGSAAALLLWLPRLRRPLERLADRAGGIYNRLTPWPRAARS